MQTQDLQAQLLNNSRRCTCLPRLFYLFSSGFPFAAVISRVWKPRLLTAMESSDSDQAPVSSTLPEHVQPAARHDTSTDLEARLPNGHGGRVSHWQAIGRAVQKLLVQSPSPPFGIDPSLPKQSLLDQAGQLCFLCLEGKGNTHVAIRIPCLRSTGYRRPIKSTYKKPETKSGCLQLMEVEYARMHPSERVFEPYSTIFGRLVDKCFEYLGNWKRWLPFHGVTDVTEVEVSTEYPQAFMDNRSLHSSRSSAQRTRMAHSQSM